METIEITVVMTEVAEKLKSVVPKAIDVDQKTIGAVGEVIRRDSQTIGATEKVIATAEEAMPARPHETIAAADATIVAAEEMHPGREAETRIAERRATGGAEAQRIWVAHRPGGGATVRGQHGQALGSDQQIRLLLH